MTDDEVMESTPLAVEFTHAVADRDRSHVDRILASVDHQVLAVVLAELLSDARKFMTQAQRVEKQRRSGLDEGNADPLGIPDCCLA